MSVGMPLQHLHRERCQADPACLPWTSWCTWFDWHSPACVHGPLTGCSPVDAPRHKMSCRLHWLPGMEPADRAGPPRLAPVWPAWTQRLLPSLPAGSSPKA